MSILKRETASMLLVYMLYIVLAYLLLLGPMTGCAGPESDPAYADAKAASLAASSSTESASTASSLTEADRLELERMAVESLDQLISTSEPARQLFEKSEGYAVFDSTKVGALVTGAGGSGVAVNPDENQCVYMHMGAGGVALGAGIQQYKLVMLFEDDESFERFVGGRWDGGATAQAVAGKAAAEAASNFVDGVAVYQITDKGLSAQADLTFVRFWQDHDAPTTEPDALRCAS
jgi:lipid-binding SYLF domain-containing protein